MSESAPASEPWAYQCMKCGLVTHDENHICSWPTTPLGVAHTENYLRVVGGLCYAHGLYTGEECPQWPKCATDSQIYKPTPPATAPSEARCTHVFYQDNRCVSCGTYVQAQPAAPEASTGSEPIEVWIVEKRELGVIGADWEPDFSTMPAKRVADFPPQLFQKYKYARWEFRPSKYQRMEDTNGPKDHR